MTYRVQASEVDPSERRERRRRRYTRLSALACEDEARATYLTLVSFRPMKFLSLPRPVREFGTLNELRTGSAAAIYMRD